MNKKIIFCLSLFFFSNLYAQGISLLGNWKVSSSTLPLESPFAHYRTTILTIEQNRFTQYDVLGRHHSKTEYKYNLHGNQLNLTDSYGKLLERFIPQTTDTLTICLDQELLECDLFQKLDKVELETGMHSVPSPLTKIIWNINGVEKEILLTENETANLFETNFEESFPRFTRIYHPDFNKPQYNALGVTLLTSCVGDDFNRIDSYIATLTLWVGIPYGGSFLVVPFAKTEEALLLNYNQPITLQGFSGEQNIKITFIFGE